MDPKTCNEWQVIEVPSEITKYVLARNKAHFGQTHGTPFTVSPLAEDLGFCGDQQPGAAQAILQGQQYDQTPFAVHVKLLLQHLQITHEIAVENSHPTITDAELVGKLKVWRELTATSPSGLHLGHYKALIARHEYSEDEDEPPSQDAGALLTWIWHFFKFLKKPLFHLRQELSIRVIQNVWPHITPRCCSITLSIGWLNALMSCTNTTSLR